MESITKIDCYILTMRGKEKRVENLVSSLGNVSVFENIRALETIYIGSPGVDNAEQSCAAGHVNILNELLASSKNSMVVLEDDVTVHDFASEKLEKIVSFVDDFDTPLLILLGGQEGVRSSAYYVGKLAAGFDFKVTEEFYSKKYLFRTCCYLINKAAAKLVIERNKSYDFRADDWASLLPDARIFLVEDAIFQHPKELVNSTIEGSRSTDLKINVFKRYYFIMLRVLLTLFKRIAVSFS